jgi:hypothetical protein
MRKLVIALSIATVTFAITTLYFARELRLARADIAASATTAAEPAISPPRADTAPVLPEAALASTPVAPNSNPNEHTVSPGHPVRMTALDANQNMRENLQKLRDPTLRGQMHDQMKGLFRDPSLAEYLGLSTSAYDQLLELHTEQYLDTMEASILCQLERDCRSSVDQSTLDAQKLAIAQLIGTENQKKLETYEMSRNERGDIERLRGRLSDKNRLTDDQAEKFIASIVDERTRIEADIKQRGGNFGVSSINGQTYYLSFDDENPDRQYEEAAAYNRRIHERAAQILSEQQLAVYDQMREETLRMMRTTAEHAGAPAKQP